MDHDSDSETAFWYNVLYFIGTHVMEVSKTDPSVVEEDDVIAKIFCGYWILTTLASIHDKSTRKENKLK